MTKGDFTSAFDDALTKYCEARAMFIEIANAKRKDCTQLEVCAAILICERRGWEWNHRPKPRRQRNVKIRAASKQMKDGNNAN